MIDENLKIFGLNVSVLGRASEEIVKMLRLLWKRESMSVLATLARWRALTARMFHIEEHGGSDGTLTRGLLRDRATVGSTASGLATVLLKFHIMISNLISAGKR